MSSLLGSKFNLCVIDLPKDFEVKESEVMDKMRPFSFKELTPSEDFGHGWCSINDIFKTSLTSDETFIEGFIVGGYRYDKKAVPGALLKKLYREKLAERSKEGGKKLKKDEKQLLKDECKQLLIVKVLPSPFMCDWIWDLKNNKIYLGAKNIKVVGDFSKLFADTFDPSSMEISDFGLKDDLLPSFLDFLWKNKSELEGTWVHQAVTLDAEKNTFKFNGPTLESYLDEIASIKDGKAVRDLCVGMALGDMDYSITFNSKNFILGVASSNKIKHESFETAVIDNADRICTISDKIKELTNIYFKK